MQNPTTPTAPVHAGMLPNTLVMHQTLPPPEYRFGVIATNPAAAIRADVA